MNVDEFWERIYKKKFFVGGGLYLCVCVRAFVNVYNGLYTELVVLLRERTFESLCKLKTRSFMNVTLFIWKTKNSFERRTIFFQLT